MLTLVGVYLAGVKVYDEAEVQAAREKPLVSFLVDLSYKRRIFEVLLDVLLVILAYYFSYVLLFGSDLGAEVWLLFLSTVPVLIFVKMAALLVGGRLPRPLALHQPRQPDRLREGGRRPGRS